MRERAIRLTRALVDSSQNDWRGAEEHIKEAIKITDRYFNDISPRAARIFINLARVYRDQKRYDEAIAAYEKAYEIRQKLYPGSKEVGYCLGASSLSVAWAIASSLICCVYGANAVDSIALAATEQIGKCMRLQGHEDEGARIEEQGRQMKKSGFGEGSMASEVHSADGELAAKKFSDCVNVLDIVDADAIASRRFTFPGKLLGERGVNLKRIEAIANCQVRYHGPWPSDMSKKDPVLWITGPSEQVRVGASH